jgi:hypothetical protein
MVAYAVFSAVPTAAVADADNGRPAICDSAIETYHAGRGYKASATERSWDETKLDKASGEFLECLEQSNNVDTYNYAIGGLISSDYDCADRYLFLAAAVNRVKVGTAETRRRGFVVFRSQALFYIGRAKKEIATAKHDKLTNDDTLHLIESDEPRIDNLYALAKRLTIENDHCKTGRYLIC